MNAFEYLLSLFGLVLGLTVVEVLSGFVRMAKIVRTRSDAVVIRVGWFTPLLAVFVLLDVTSYWANIWPVRNMIPVELDIIFFGLAISATYYFAASMVFPDDPKSWPDLDAWFWLHKRHVIGPLIFVNLVWAAIPIMLTGEITLLQMGLQTLFFLPLVMAFLSNRAVIVASALTLNISIYLFFAIANLAARLKWISFST